MILQALTRYYDILAEDEESDIALPGYSKAKISFAANISAEGELLELIPLKKTVRRGKKDVEIPLSETVPEQVKRSSGVASNFLCDNSSYFFGVDNKGKPKRSKECFEAFKKLHEEILRDVDCVPAKAVLNCLSKWQVEKALEHKCLAGDLEEIFKANIVFKLDGGEFIHNDGQIKLAWEKYKDGNNVEETTMNCLVTGEQSLIERVHPLIKGIKGAQTAGASIVSFNARAYESYGKIDGQGMNSPVSKKAAFAYGTTLNYLLADEKHRLSLGDATIVYWAESADSEYRDIVDLLLQPDELENIGKYVSDSAAIKIASSVFRKIADCEFVDYKVVDSAISDNVNFYILALSPNAARLSIRFFLKDNFGGFINKIAKHYEDMQIERSWGTEKKYISLWSILNQTVSPKSTDKSASPLLAGSVLRAILQGTPYPVALMNYVVMRIRAEHNINYEKTAIIKAYLKRKNKFTEVVTMSLNKDSKEPAYLTGRLFAILEKLQDDANNGNTNIREKYFSSASANPKTVFPTLLKLAQHHIAKVDNNGRYYDRLISEIIECVKQFPSSLSLDEQGVFILGYYHQKNDLWKKKENRA